MVPDVTPTGIVVQKYGGSSVADVDKIKLVAQRIARTKAAGKKVVVVVSAMGKTTNQLIEKAKAISRVAVAARARHAADLRRARGDGAALDGVRRAGPRGDLVHRLAGRHPHERSPLRRAHHRGPAVPHRGRARSRQGRDRRRLSGRVVQARDHDARPRRLGHHRGRARRRAARRLLRDLQRRRRRVHRRPARSSPAAELLAVDQPRRDARARRAGREGPARRVGRVRTQERHRAVRARDRTRTAAAPASTSRPSASARSPRSPARTR